MFQGVQVLCCAKGCEFQLQALEPIPHRLPIGLRSGLRADRSKGSISFSSNHDLDKRLTWIAALSCWRVKSPFMSLSVKSTKQLKASPGSSVAPRFRPVSTFRAWRTLPTPSEIHLRSCDEVWNEGPYPSRASSTRSRLDRLNWNFFHQWIQYLSTRCSSAWTS